MAQRKSVEADSFLAGFDVLVVIFTALIVQILGQYIFRWTIGDHFFASWTVLRVGLPVLALFLLKVPLSHLGLGRPRFDSAITKFIGLLLFGGALVLVGLYFHAEYYDTYSGRFGGSDTDAGGRISRFLVFTSSTLPAWEFLHRSFLLMGLLFLFRERKSMDERTARQIAIGIVCAFEVLFHFIKTRSYVEPLGLLIGSPILSYVAIRTNCVWIALTLHFLVELLFVLSLVLQ